MLDTIVALATPPMKSAIAVIRVSGEESFEIVSKVFSKNLNSITKRDVHYGHIIDGDNIIDEVMLINYVKPHSFTGENSVEIMCHGSLLIANEIIELLVSKGARLATRGEFTSRAYMNGRIDLIQAEAINDVINATSKEAKKLSIMSLQGKTTKLLDPLKTTLADLMSNIEVNIDYPEYMDIEVVSKERIITDGENLHNVIQKLISEGEEGAKIKEGISVALVGKPNVGKSSLLNALLKEEKAIVTDIAGTTRDIVEGDITLKGVTFHLFDTAGIHESNDVVESIGINKAKKTIEEADIVILLLDAQRGLDQDDELLIKETKNKNPIIVYNKMDINYKENAINISAKEHKIDELINELMKRVNISEESFSRPSLNNARQIGLLKKADLAILKAVEDAKLDLPVDLIAVSLFEAYNSILSIMGDSVNTDISKEIFSRFCVGK
ncbi:MAG: tRNA uridine-5-carboxymethylaminomethyl(34) synthesis GTPase MnmE [Erysipelotrichales bacterium]|nr:tRNA uridine-5-carboxymethylaminomethyl(34) synthesis GTPase MnmE [Erysipelotrichales bacterium]